jgi:RimJ/RimL family protein N-acetyltransferase
MLDHWPGTVKMGPMIRLVWLSGRHASDLALLAADEWDVPGFVTRAQRLRARGERATFAVLDGKRLVGVAMLGRDRSEPGRAELGYWIGPGERGHGHATAAAQQLLTRAFGLMDVALVFATCSETNHASARVLSKLGFRRVGVAKDPDALDRYELTREEWRVT